MADELSKTQLRSDLTAAIKARDAVRTRTLRAVLTAVQLLETSDAAEGEATPAQISDILAGQAKTRRESLTAYRAAGRDDLADPEQAELDILAEYLPQQLTADEIEALVATTIADVGATDASAMGKVMGALTPKTKGKADGGAVAAEVRRQLS